MNNRLDYIHISGTLKALGLKLESRVLGQELWSHENGYTLLLNTSNRFGNALVFDQDLRAVCLRLQGASREDVRSRIKVYFS